MLDRGEKKGFFVVFELFLLLDPPFANFKLDNKFMDDDEADRTIRFENINFLANDFALLLLELFVLVPAD